MEVPDFKTVDEAKKFISEMKAGNDLVNQKKESDPESISKTEVTKLIADSIEKTKKEISDEADLRLKKVMLQDESTTNAIKKTFKEDKDYEAWEKEVEEGKVSVKEIEILSKRGSDILHKEAEEAKSNESNVETDPDGPKKINFIDAHKEIDKLISNPDKSLLSNDLSDEDRAEVGKKVGEIIDSIDHKTMSQEEKNSLSIFNELVHHGKTSANPDGGTHVEAGGAYI